MPHNLFSSFELGPNTLQNRVVMAPMTRCRAIENTPNELMAEYYSQRAEAGLIVTEGTAPAANGLGYARIPGLFSEDQARGWRLVTDAVHANGSKIFVQLMHVGRVGHPLNLPAGARLMAPSAIAAPGEMHTDADGPKPHPVPAEMTEQDIEQTIDEYAQSAQLAIESGFDGVELHGANGYLIDQFLNTASNRRGDLWGGSVENRLRFAVQTARRLSRSIGPDRVGMRISPYGEFNGMKPDADHDALYAELAKALSDIGLAYIHVVDHSAMGMPPVKDEIKRTIRRQFNGAYILSGGYDLNRAQADLVEEYGDLVAFGRPFIANPKLVSKLKNGSPLNDPVFDQFYTPGAEGYTDYPIDS